MLADQAARAQGEHKAGAPVLDKPKRKKAYKQNISDQQRLQLEAGLSSRGFDGRESEIDLLLRGGSIPSGAGLRVFYRNHRLQEDDKWRQWY